MYGNKSAFDNLPAAYNEIATAGLNAPPEIAPPNNTGIAKPKPISCSKNYKYKKHST